MLKTLLKKQMYEIFRSYFYNPKTNKSRSPAGTAGFITLFAVLMLFIAGSIFAVCLTICPQLIEVECGWLYFALMGTVAVLLGTFGSVFNTFAGLYLSKDNDLLLSMPIPVKSIIAARLFGVFITGAMYSSIVTLPAAIVYFIFAKFTVNGFIGTLLWMILPSVLVLVLSSALGYVIARLTVKLKNKSFITVIIALLFFAVYYLAFFKFRDIISGLVTAVVAEGPGLKYKAYPVYMIGCVGEGNILGMLASVAVHAGLVALTVWVISRSFIRIANSANQITAVKRSGGKIRQRSLFSALLAKEGKRFTSSATYMLNAGFGLAFFPVVAVLVFVFKGTLIGFGADIGVQGGTFACAVAAVAITMIVSMIEIIVPSVSLEGKTLWQLKSMPISTITVLKAKMAFQIIVVGIPAFVASVCAAIALASTLLEAVGIILLPLGFLVFNTVFGLILSITMANVNWTNEIIPIKQNLNVMFALFGGWILVILLCAPSVAIGIFFGANAFGIYSFGVTALFVIVSLAIYYGYIKNGGVKAFERL